MIADVKKRALSLSRVKPKEPHFNVNRLYESVLNVNTPYSSKSVESILENWEFLHPDTNVAFAKAFLVMEEAYLNDNDSNIGKYTNIFTEAIVPKVRNATQMQTTIKRRLGMLKSKLSTKISKKIGKIAAAHTRKKAAPQQQANQVQNKQESATIDKSLQTISEAIENAISADRIINNHAKLNKRYNIDGFIKESVFTKSQANDAAIEFCKLIETYNIPDKAKYSIAIENSIYAFEKNFVPYEKQSVLETITDYFLICHNQDNKMPGIIETVLERSTLYDSEDFAKLDILPVITEDIDIDSFFTEATADGIVLTEGIASKVKLLTESKSKGNKLIEAIKDFKLQPLKRVESLKNTIKSTVAPSEDNILKETPNILGNVCLFLVITSSIAISVPLGILTTLTAAFLHYVWTQDQTEEQIKHYENNLKKTESKIEKTKDPKQKERLEEYKSALEKDLEKLKDYRENHKAEWQKNDEEKTKESEDSSDDFSVDESVNIATNIIAISEGVKYLSEKTNIIEAIDEKINTLSPADIDFITEFSLSNPDILDPNELKYILQEQRDETLKLSSINKYVRSSVLSDNIRKLEAYTLKEITEQSTEEVLKFISESIIARDSIIEFLEYTKIQQQPILELSFSNTIDMVVERVKKAATNLSDKEKVMSKTIDTSLENLGKGLTDAFKAENREAVIRGKVLPPASRIIKMAIVSGLAWMVSPAVAVIGLIASAVYANNIRASERQIVLDELDVELNMCNRYIKNAEDKNDLKTVRNLLMIKKKLEAQRSRLKYKMHTAYKDEVPNNSISDHDDDY